MTTASMVRAIGTMHEGRVALGRRMREEPASAVAVLVLLLVAVVLIGGPLLPIYDPYTQGLSRSLLPMWSTASDGSFHVLGTDAVGGDTFSQLVLGGRTSVFIAVCSVCISAAIGPTLGAVAGYLGGVVDRIVAGIVDLLLAVPRVLVIIAVVSVLGPSEHMLILLFGATGWVTYARVVRSLAMSVRTREYVRASISMGAGRIHILRRHILPSTFHSVMVIATLDIGVVIILEASLSYLGLGVQPPGTSWGLMIQRAQSYVQTAPRLLVIPSVALVIFVVTINLVGRLLTGESGAQSARYSRGGL